MWQMRYLQQLAEKEADAGRRLPRLRRQYNDIYMRYATAEDPPSHPLPGGCYDAYVAAAGVRSWEAYLTHPAAPGDEAVQELVDPDVFRSLLRRSQDIIRSWVATPARTSVEAAHIEAYRRQSNHHSDAAAFHRRFVAAVRTSPTRACQERFAVSDMSSPSPSSNMTMGAHSTVSATSRASFQDASSSSLFGGGTGT